MASPFDWLFNLFKPPQQQQPQPPARPINLAVQGPQAAKLALPPNIQPKIQPQQPAGRIPAQTFIDMLGNYARQYAQGVGSTLQQGVGHPADELIRSILSFGSAALGKPQLDNPKPTGIESFIAGPQPINTIQTQTQQASQALTQAGHPTVAKFVPFLAPVLAGLDVAGLSPGKGQAKKAAQGAAKAALETGMKQGVKNIDNTVVSSLGGVRTENTAQKAIEDALNAGDISGAQKLVGGIQNKDLKAGLQSTIDSISGNKPPIVPPGIPANAAANAAGKIKATRFASKTVPESPYVGPEISKIVEENAPNYIQGNNKQQLRSALQTMQAKGIDAHATDIYDKIKSTKTGSILPQDAADAFAAAQALEFRSGAGDAVRAADIYDTLSSHFTASGQLSQVAALLKARSPDGVALSAQRDLKKAGTPVTDEIRSTINRFKDAISKTAPNSDERGKAVNELGKYVASKMPKSPIGNRLTDIWRAGLLTGPVTTTGNLLGNFSVALGKKALSDPVAALADRFQSLLTGKRTKVATFRGTASGVAEGAQRGGTYLKTGYDPRNIIQKYDIPKTNYGNGPLGKIFHNYTQAIYRYQGAQDQPFYYSSLKNSLSDQALAAAKNQGLKGGERQKFIAGFIKNPPAEASKAAEADANRSVFANETRLGKAAAGLQKNLGPVGTFLVPFTRIPASIAMRVLDSTPIGTARELITQIGNMRKGLPYDQRAMSEAIGNGSIGTLLIPAGYALSKAGDITLGYPKDPKEQELWKQERKQPYSVRVGNEWVSMNYIQPFGTLIAIGGQFNNARREGQDAWNSFISSGGIGAQSIVNQSFLKGLQSTINAINDPQRYASQFYENTAGSVIPNLIRTVARATDPNQRQINGSADALAAGIPGLRENLPAQTDTFGNDLPATSSTGNQLLNPLRPSDVRATAGSVTTELRRLQDSGNGLLPNNITATSLGKGVTLNKDQIDQVTRFTGPKVQSALDAAIRDPRYQSLTDQQKADVLNQINKDVVAAYKADWGTKNNVVTPDQINLTKTQKNLLSGQQIDWVGNEIQSLQPKPPKQPKAKKAGIKHSAGRSGGRTTSSAGPKVSLRAIRVSNGKSAVRSLQTRPHNVKVSSKIKGFKLPRLATARSRKIKTAALA
jgi:hypothetical protein